MNKATGIILKFYFKNFYIVSHPQYNNLGQMVNFGHCNDCNDGLQKTMVRQLAYINIVANYVFVGV